ncbi:hypothetical protein [Agromyces sp. NPDC058110]|uniref:hypothetical protein n=1 Tax=Agromyces sp. NPDC058110 TaxID=3346345 RepID=UPI0036DE33D0
MTDQSNSQPIDPDARAADDGEAGEYTETDFGTGAEERTVPGEGEYTETDFPDGVKTTEPGEGEYTETEFPDGVETTEPGKGEYTETDPGK